MIEYIQGNIFDSQAQTIVNTVNTVGVMGAGLALEFKNRYPKMFQAYKSACDNGSFSVGKLMLCKEQDFNILLFPTKAHWKELSKIEYIEVGLKRFIVSYNAKGITSIAFPKLGCGKGGLRWDEVKPLMEEYLGNLDLRVYVYI